MNDAITLEKNKVSVKEVGYLFIKRLFDIVCGLLGCILILPIAIVVKIAYVCDKDFSSIFYSQIRIGKNGKKFKMYKFRSMVPNADEILFKTLEIDKVAAEEYRKNKKFKNDPRITKVGRVMRKLSIDELPQLINILKGDMSMIGNRPYLPRERDDMGEYYKDIIKTKPGLTGYWQVNGRSDTTFNERLKLESFYSNHNSLVLDIKIFFKTFQVVLFGKGAK
ncbi:MAG: sugar transferase [Clostridium sp.]|nr:sugar transferase [Clostridium sp.]